MGKPETSVLSGNFKWLGSYDECVDIRASINESGEITHPWKGQYCTTVFKLKPLGKVLLVYCQAICKHITMQCASYSQNHIFAFSKNKTIFSSPVVPGSLVFKASASGAGGRRFESQFVGSVLAWPVGEPPGS